MKFRVRTILLVIFLCGCSSAEMTEEQKQKIQTEMLNYHDSILKPAIFTALSTCIYRLEKEAWPTFIDYVSESELLSNYQVISHNPFTVQYQVKPSVVFWHVTYSIHNNDCIYSISVRSDKLRGGFSEKGKINKIEIKDFNEDKIEKYLHYEILPFQFMVFKAMENAENSNIPEKNQSFEKLFSVLGEAVLKVAICALLGISESSCT